MSVKNISPAELNQRLTADPALAVIDVRTPPEYNTVHLAQARNLPLDGLDPKALVEDGTLPKDQPVYVLCHSGGRATRAAEKFASQGYANAIVVEGGTQGWGSAGLPVTRGQSGVISLERQVRQSILADAPIAIVEPVAKKHGTTDLAKAYLDYLFTDEVQEVAAKNYFRPANPEILKKHAASFPEIKLVTIDEILGGWKKALEVHFKDGGVFDQIYAR